MNDWVLYNRELVHSVTKYYPVKELGSGAWGTVFSTNNPDVVIKITAHNIEAKTIAIILKLRSEGVYLSNIANFHSLIHFNMKMFNERLESRFFIVREYLEPCVFKCQHFCAYLSSQSDFNRRKYYRFLKRIRKDYSGLYQTLTTLAYHKVFLWDVCEPNVGRSKDGRFHIIHDVVATRPLPTIEIPSVGLLDIKINRTYQSEDE